MSGQIVVGTSSWADPGFVAEWYPPGMPARDRLSWYAERFAAVELNSSFYAVPGASTVERWAAQTPPGFTFHVKLHRLLSRHATEPGSLPPDMRDEVRVDARHRVALDEALELALAQRIVEACEPLARAGKLGAFLLQLSPSFQPKRNELAEIVPLLEALAPHAVAVELRNRNWVDGERAGETLGFLSDHDAAWVCVDTPPADHFTIMPELDAVTRDGLAYMRLHGRNADGYLTGKTVAERFAYDYSDPELEGIAARANTLAEQAGLLMVAFNNNRGRDAPTSARRLRELLGQDPGPSPDAGEGQLRLGA